MFLDHTQRRTTVGRTYLDELITRPEESYQLCCVVVCDLETSRIGAPYTEWPKIMYTHFDIKNITL